MKSLFAALVLFVIPVVTTGVAEEQQKIPKLGAMALLKGRDPAKEFIRSVKGENVCFYAIGSGFYGVTVPGLSSEDVEQWIETVKIPVRVQFSDDPPPLNADKEFWDRAKDFVETYNQLTVIFLENCSMSSERPGLGTKGTGCREWCGRTSLANHR